MSTTPIPVPDIQAAIARAQADRKLLEQSRQQLIDMLADINELLAANGGKRGPGRPRGSKKKAAEAGA